MRQRLRASLPRRRVTAVTSGAAARGAALQRCLGGDALRAGAPLPCRGLVRKPARLQRRLVRAPRIAGEVVAGQRVGARARAAADAAVLAAAAAAEQRL